MIRFTTGLAFAAGLMQVYASAQAPEAPIAQSRAQQYFREAQTMCSLDHGQLWGISLCGPIMFVDPQSRSIVANTVDANGVIKAEGNVFVGYLPKDQNIATQPLIGPASIGLRSCGLCRMTSVSETP